MTRLLLLLTLAAGAVFGPRQHGTQSLAVALVHGVEHLARDRLGQVTDKVREVIDLETLGRRHQFAGLHGVDELLAHFFMELDEHIALEVPLDHLPDEFALSWRDGLEQQGDLGGVQRRHHALRRAQRTGVEGLAQRAEPHLLVCELGHVRPGISRE
jgi:hypothetical protein